MAVDNQVAEGLLGLLAARGIGAGDRLPSERALAGELGVSRSHLREGMRRLVDLGVVRSRQGSGNYLAPIDLRDLTAARLRIEPYAARLAAERRTEADLSRLAEALAGLRSSLGNAVEFADLDAQLHRLVTDASGSPALRVLLDALGDLLRYSRTTTAVDPALREETLSQLEALVEAIQRGDGDAAEGEMRSHLHAVASRHSSPHIG